MGGSFFFLSLFDVLSELQFFLAVAGDFFGKFLEFGDVLVSVAFLFFFFFFFFYFIVFVLLFFFVVLLVDLFVILGDLFIVVIGFVFHGRFRLLLGADADLRLFQLFQLFGLVVFVGGNVRFGRVQFAVG